MLLVQSALSSNCWRVMSDSEFTWIIVLFIFSQENSPASSATIFADKFLQNSSPRTKFSKRALHIMGTGVTVVGTCWCVWTPSVSSHTRPELFLGTWHQPLAHMRSLGSACNRHVPAWPCSFLHLPLAHLLCLRSCASSGQTLNDAERTDNVQ